METSIDGARGVLINITGSSDMGLEDVEAAADLVQEAAHPDANIIFGASFDESMQDEIRVTVIATGFEQGSAKKAAKAAAAPAAEAAAPAPAPAAPQAPSVPPVFQPASGMKPVVPNAAPVTPAPAKEDEPAEPAEDPFESIFKIFNTK